MLYLRDIGMKFAVDEVQMKLEIEGKETE